MINRWTLFILIVGGEIELVVQNVWVAIPFIVIAFVVELVSGLSNEQKEELKDCIWELF